MKISTSALRNILEQRNNNGKAKKFFDSFINLAKGFDAFCNHKAHALYDPLHYNLDIVSKYFPLFESIRDNGVIQPIIIYSDKNGIEIDGYHRLSIAITLGIETVECVFKRPVLIVMAHPDDELLFGYPLLQDESVDKKVLICSSDIKNPRRKNRKAALKDVCTELGIEYECLDYNSGFYRLESRKNDLLRFIEIVATKVKKYSFVYTHNPHGEYGHLDHQLVSSICRNSADHILYSNIVFNSNWTPIKDITLLSKKIYYNNTISTGSLDLDWFKKHKAIYDKYKCWTWSYEPVKEYRLFLK